MAMQVGRTLILRPSDLQSVKLNGSHIDHFKITAAASSKSENIIFIDEEGDINLLKIKSLESFIKKNHPIKAKIYDSN